MAHAESIKAIEDLKQRLTQSQTAAREGRAAAETAQAKLASSEASWQQQREAFDKEIVDLQLRLVPAHSVSCVPSILTSDFHPGARILANRTNFFTNTLGLSRLMLPVFSKQQARQQPSLARVNLPTMLIQS